MTRMEDLLRSATSAAAAQVRPDSITPLDPATLAGPRRSRLRRVRLASAVATALAVAVVVTLSVTVPSVVTGQHAGPAHRPAAKPSRRPQAASPPVTIPAYYVALTGVTYPWYDNPLAITVRDTMTGAVLATVMPPTPYGTFTLVDGTADDTTFLVGAQPWQPQSNSAYADNNNGAPVTLMLLHFDPATRQVSFTRLPVPALPGPGSNGTSQLQAVALSPDGTKLAVGLQANSDELDLDVFSLPGGAERTWSVHGAAVGQSAFAVPGAGDGMLSWRPDGRTLAFDWTEPDAAGSGGIGEIRLLDTSQPAGDLLADSRQIFSLDASGSFNCSGALLLSADASTATCAGLNAVAPKSSFGFAEFSVATGRLVTLLDPTPSDQGANPQILWSDGDTIIGTLYGPAFILVNGQEHGIPWDQRISPDQGGSIDAAW